VAARFEVLEERTQSELIDRLRMSVLLQASADPNSALGRALATAITTSADVTFNEMIVEAIGRRDEISAWIARAGSVEAAIIELSRALGVEPAETSDRIDAEILDGPNLPPSEWAAVAALCKASSSNDQR